LLGSGKSSSASKSAAQDSYYSTMASIQAETDMYGAAQTALQPYNWAGQAALSPMQSMAAQTPAGQRYLDQANAALGQVGGYQNEAQGYRNQAQGYQNEAQGYLTQAAGMNPSNVLTLQGLEQTPGYQFTQQQGLKATQAAAAARGLGVSGASLKGAATYATGLADATYSNRFNEAQTSYQDVLNQSGTAINLGTGALNLNTGALNAAAAQQNTATGYLNQATSAQQQQQQQYNQYANLASLGENAAAMTGQAATTSGGQQASSYATGASQYGNYLTQAGQAQAAGTTGAANALTSGVNNYLSYSTLQDLIGASGGTTASANTQFSNQLSDALSNVTLPYTQGNTY
jgi:hypothetical protein